MSIGAVGFESDFSGCVERVLIYSEALTQEQVQQAMLSTVEPTAAPTAAPIAPQCASTSCGVTQGSCPP